MNKLSISAFCLLVITLFACKKVDPNAEAATKLNGAWKISTYTQSVTGPDGADTLFYAPAYMLLTFSDLNETKGNFKLDWYDNGTFDTNQSSGTFEVISDGTKMTLIDNDEPNDPSDVTFTTLSSSNLEMTWTEDGQKNIMYGTK